MAILKFGTVELFKEIDEEEKEVQLDIDDVLKLAENPAKEAKLTATEEFLSNFNVRDSIKFKNIWVFISLLIPVWNHATFDFMW